MKLKSAVMALTLILSLAIPVCAEGAENVALEVGVSDIHASAPLCTYWYQLGAHGITPIMVVTNHGVTPIMVSAVRLPDSTAVIAGVPREIAQAAGADFVLDENPGDLVIQKRAVKQAVVFTISNLGG